MPISYHDELAEVNFGSLRNTPFLAEHQQRHVNLDYDWHELGGESFDDVKRRVASLLHEVKQESGNREALLVCHGGIVRMLTFLESGEKRGEISNAALFEFDIHKMLDNS